MIPVIDAAPQTAPAPHPVATERRGFFRRCLARLRPAGFALTMFETVTHGTQRLSEREQAAGRINLLMMQRTALMVEHARLVSDRAEAVRNHRSVTSLDKRLRLVTAQLLSIG